MFLLPLLLVVIRLYEKGSFCKLVLHINQLDKNGFVAVRWDSTKESDHSKCVAVQLSASQPPTRPKLTLSLSQKWKTNRGFVFPALESNSAVFRSADTCGFSSKFHQPLCGLTLACWECVGELIWFIYLHKVSHKLVILFPQAPLNM